MLKKKDLDPMRPRTRYPQGENLTLVRLQERIEECASRYGVPIAFYGEELRDGGLINNSTDACLCAYHPEHQDDYHGYCITLDKQGTYAFVSVYTFGRSKQGVQLAKDEAARANRKGASLTYKAGSLAAQGVRALMRDNKKVEEEKNYYLMMSDVFDEVIGGE